MLIVYIMSPLGGCGMTERNKEEKRTGDWCAPGPRDERGKYKSAIIRADRAEGHPVAINTDYLLV